MIMRNVSSQQDSLNACKDQAAAAGLTPDDPLYKGFYLASIADSFENGVIVDIGS